MSSAGSISEALQVIHDDRRPRPAFRVLGVQISVQLVLMLLSVVLLVGLIVLALAEWASRR